MSDKVIPFPGAGASPDPAKPEAQQGVPGQIGSLLGLKLSADQEKALGIVLGGMSFVCIGIEPTGNGADFFTALHGKAQDLADAHPHLPGVIDRAFRRKGID